MNPLIAQALRNAAATPTPAPAPAPSGPDFAPLIAMFTKDEAGGASAQQVGGIWSVDDPGRLFQNSNGTGAVTADGDPVGYVQNLVAAGIPLLQATAAARPIYRVSGGVRWLEFGGTQFLRTASNLWGGAAVQPYSRVNAVRVLQWVLNRTVIGPYEYNNHGFVYMAGAEPNLQLHNGSNLNNNTLAVGADGVIYDESDGSSSILQIDNLAAAAGAAGVGGTGGGLTIGAGGTGADGSKIRWHGGMLIGRRFGAGEAAAAKAVMAQLQGRTL